MRHLIESHSFIVELTPVKQRAAKLRENLQKFADRYQRVIDAGYCVSVPDNPMGNLSFQCTELIGELSLPVPEEQVLCHLNTFHTKDELTSILSQCRELGIKNVLVITGDGGDRLPKLAPEDVGASATSVTSVELTRYIKQTHDGVFRLGVAFNQYEPEDFEFDKLRKKLDAGAEFIITQPVVGKEETISRLTDIGVPVFLEAWMSSNTKLLADCIGYDVPADYTHDPLESLRCLVEKHPDYGFYTALLGFKTQFPVLDEIWT